jgi:glycosyltransferase involved in cell wall biosynthesis
MVNMKEYAGKVLMLLENRFPIDPRVRNEVYTLAEAGYKVSIIALRDEDEKNKEEVNGVTVYRVPIVNLFKKSGSSTSQIQIMLNRLKSAIGYLFEYFYFTSACFLLSLYIAIREGFDVVHVHNPPNTLFLVGLYYRLFGKKFVFDHHDLEPELYLSRYDIKENFVYKMLLLQEKLCLRFANMVIATNESYKEIDIERAKIEPEKVFVVRNGPVLESMRLMPPDEELKRMGKSILVYIGVMGPQDGVDYLLRSLRNLVYNLGRADFYCIIIGQGDAVKNLKILTHELKIEDFVRFTGRIPRGDLLRYLSTADICVDPNPSSPLNDVSTWIKVMEYMALGKPIVSFDLKETRYTAQKAAIYVTPNNEREFAEAIVRLMNDPAERTRRGEFGRKRIVNELDWNHVSKNLLFAYDTILPRPQKTIQRNIDILKSSNTVLQ